MKKILSVLLTLSVLSMPALALELDLSVDDEIRKNYNPSKIEQENLPPIPNIKPVQPISKPTQPTVPQQITKPPSTLQPLTPSTTAPVITKVDKSLAIKIKKGTKFKVKSNQVISDGLREGTRLSFTSLNPVYQKFITIPAGTVFKGQVLDSHYPQYAGNGGLVVIMVDSMVYKGAARSVSARITKANHKKIFINNIKGHRGYLKGVAKSVQPGTKFYKKMMRLTSKMAGGSVTVLLTPFTVVAGVLVWGVNVIGSPVFAIFSKGGRIIIPAGSEFEIKILEDVYLY